MSDVRRCDYNDCLTGVDVKSSRVARGFCMELNRMVHFCSQHGNEANKFPSSRAEAMSRFDKAVMSMDEAYGMSESDTVIVTNEQGGKQSAIITSLYKLDPDVILALGAVLGYGAHKYGDEGIAIGSENWRKIPHTDHLDHMLEHVFMYMRELKREQLGLGPDLSDEDRGLHLDHVVCRAMFAHATKDQYHLETMKAAQKKS